MLLYLFFIFFFFLAIVWIGIALLGTFFRRLFGFGQSDRSRSGGNYHTGRNYDTNGTHRSRQANRADHDDASSTSGSSSDGYWTSSSGTWQSVRSEQQTYRGRRSSAHQKVFGSDEGEYVDFEEVEE